MRPAFIIIALSAFAVARPFESVEGLLGKRGPPVPPAPQLGSVIKQVAHAVVGKACHQAKEALAARSLDITDFEANLNSVAQETYQQMVDDHALEDSPENYAIIKDLLKAGSSKLLDHGCDTAQAALASRDVDGDDGLVDTFHKIKGHVVNVVKGIKDKISRIKGGKAAPVAAPAAAAPAEEAAAAPAEPAAEVAA
ncbi:hypothetical protein EYR40_008552 [Pleurotus pulmonarius]|nr:hypothetical protein EYR36_009369 [Pleurotus pulmonarius]KAF4592865.1 hypothetical protein EYR38_008571 [Pleurotus pulmonarius]KAF4593758.1 hypothetical protein EYR40_008552 [Pleurotus pulmonarius]